MAHFNVGANTLMRFFWIPVDSSAPYPWLVALLLVLVGGVGLMRNRAAFQQVWAQAQAEVDLQIGRAAT